MRREAAAWIVGGHWPIAQDMFSPGDFALGQLHGVRAAMRLPAVGDLGWRVHLSQPEGLMLRPGEPVDARMRSQR